MNDLSGQWEPPAETEAPPELSELLRQAAELKDLVNGTKNTLETLQEKLTKVTTVILRQFELMEIDTTKAHGYLFYSKTKSSVKTPKTNEEKKEFFDWAESKQLFWELVSVNSNTLNSLYKTEAEIALKSGVLDFRLPGIGAPETYTTLELKKA